MAPFCNCTIISAIASSCKSQAVYAFWQYDLCDVFIELMKPVMALDEAADPSAAGRKLATRNTLWVCLETGLR